MEVEFRSPMEYELFDVSKDPWQLEDLFGTEDVDLELVHELQEYLHQEIVVKDKRN